MYKFNVGDRVRLSKRGLIVYGEELTGHKYTIMARHVTEKYGVRNIWYEINNNITADYIIESCFTKIDNLMKW